MNKINFPKIKRNKGMKVDFERTNWFKRFRLKFLTGTALAKLISWVFRFVLLLGISYVILFPFYSQIVSSFKGRADFADATIKLIPKTLTLDTYKTVIVERDYFGNLLGTATLSFVCAIIQTFVCALIGYGFAKYKFKGKKLLFALVVFTMVVPHQTLRATLGMKFQFFDFGVGSTGLLRWLGIGTIDMTQTVTPLLILSITGLAFKNGLFIFMMKQFFAGVPDELEESAYMDGYGPFKTFFKIIIPISIPMLITVFLFSFAWQWTDNFYVRVFSITENESIGLLNNIKGVPGVLVDNENGYDLYKAAIYSTETILVMSPLVVIYLFCQKYLVQGIERSGIVG